VRRALVIPMFASLAFSGCGYHVGGKADLLPSTLHTIAIPAFGNNTTRYKLTEILPGAIGREFITRTRYRIVADPNEADAILRGTVVSSASYPIIFDQATGRASSIQMNVVIELKLVDRVSGKMLFERSRMESHGRYEVTTNEIQYFDESSTALDRISREIARQVVSSILEAF